VITHERRSGVGAATITGYRRALAEGLDVVAVMNGDNQMDAADLPTLVGRSRGASSTTPRRTG
jgi:hypothetical protein